MANSVQRLLEVNEVVVNDSAVEDLFNLKPLFHGACFEADSAPILSAPYTRQARPYPARIRRVQNRRRIRFKTRSMENGLYSILLRSLPHLAWVAGQPYGPAVLDCLRRPFFD